MNQITNIILSNIKTTNVATVSMGYDSIENNIILSRGEGAKFPDPSTNMPYDIVWWNVSDYITPTDDPYVEIVRCIAKFGDTLIVMRAQQQTLASSKNIPSKLYNMMYLPNGYVDTLSYYNVPQPHGIASHTGIIGAEANITFSNTVGHAHTGSDSTKVDHINLASKGTNTHAQIDSHIASNGTSVHGLGTMSTQNSNNVSITGGTSSLDQLIMAATYQIALLSNGNQYSACQVPSTPFSAVWKPATLGFHSQALCGDIQPQAAGAGNAVGVYGGASNKSGFNCGALWGMNSVATANTGFTNVLQSIECDINVNAGATPSVATGISIGGYGNVNYGLTMIRNTGVFACGLYIRNATNPIQLADFTVAGILHNAATSGVVTSSLIVNADVATGAAIVYSKLNLGNSIVNADISSGAYIAYSKLSLGNSIVNADISSGAAIVYSKLSLGNSIVNADVAAAAAIARSKIAAPVTHNVTASRAASTTYRNTSGGTMFLSVTANNSTTANLYLCVDTVTPAAALYSVAGISAIGWAYSLSAVIPNNSYYQVYSSAGALTITQWIETY